MRLACRQKLEPLGAPVLGPKTQELIDVLDQLVAVLSGDGNGHWSKWMRTAAARLRNHDASGISYLLSAYGGMGSLNGVVLGYHSVGGQLQQKPGSGDLNVRFQALRDRAWELADSIQRDHHTEGT